MLFLCTTCEVHIRDVLNVRLSCISNKDLVSSRQTVSIVNRYIVQLTRNAHSLHKMKKITRKKVNDKHKWRKNLKRATTVVVQRIDAFAFLPVFSFLRREDYKRTWGPSNNVSFHCVFPRCMLKLNEERVVKATMTVYTCSTGL